MRRIQILRLFLLLAVVSFSTLAAPSTAHAYPLCPGLPREVVRCADVTAQCTSGGGTPTLTWLGLCQDDYYYLWEYYSVSCSGVLYECADYW